jgi:hypothetical protein
MVRVYLHDGFYILSYLNRYALVITRHSSLYWDPARHTGRKLIW